ncbi:MAG: thioredoxin domain-containing protein [Ruminococcaceae bacterium]|nr:thioredoxin domain-containing protein [Oscillospiraceae bacterium]
MNRLQYEKSPYLLQHADNPVDWRPWGEEAFAAARQENKPVFLSIGYSTCHWCHVMARESFSDEAVARAINDAFIPVKVDREERPDVDAVYMAACIAMNDSGGWPLTVLLTPEQKPFWAGTYLPKGQLLALVEEVGQLWQEARETVLAAGSALTEHLRQAGEAEPGRPSRALAEEGASAFVRMLDREWGGFGRAPKFPAAHNLLFLLRYARLAEDDRTREAAELTLSHMYRGGIFDHVGGGFSRYATDRRWLVPHFEKMLYDNALLAMAYTELWQESQQDWCRRAVCRTLDYVLAELTDPAGGFYCGQDADSEGQEGLYYVFTPEELCDVLGGEAEGFCRRYGVTEQGNFHGKNILHLLEAVDWQQLPGGMNILLRRLYDYRTARAKLHRDDKVLTAWNGLTIAALARAGLVLEEPAYLAAAERAVSFIDRHLRGENGTLLARWRGGEAAYAGKLEDYAFYVWGLLELYGATFRVELLEEACQLAEMLLEKFFDPQQGGFYPYAADGEQLITRIKETRDGAIPSGNAVAALVLSRLGRLTGEQRWREAAQMQLRYLAGAIGSYPSEHSFTLLVLLEELWPTAELICAARKVPTDLRDFLRRRPRPNLTALARTEENAARLAKLAPFTASYPIPSEGVRYYLCRSGSCSRPVASPGELEKLL